MKIDIQSVFAKTQRYSFAYYNSWIIGISSIEIFTLNAQTAQEKKSIVFMIILKTVF